MSETLYRPSSQELANYFAQLTETKFPAGFNGPVRLPEMGESLHLPGFVNCPAVVEVTPNHLWLLHHHFESRLKDQSTIEWPTESQGPFLILGTNADRMIQAGMALKQRYGAAVKTEYLHLKNGSLVSELMITREENSLKVTFFDPFNPETATVSAHLALA